MVYTCRRLMRQWQMKLTLDVLVRAEDAGDRQEAAEEVKEEAEIEAEDKAEAKEEVRADLHPKHPQSTNPSNQPISFAGIVGRKATGLQLAR